MPYPPRHYNICPCCGTEFDNDDVDFSFAELRYNWIISGARWFFGQPPNGWNAAAQLAKASFGLQTEAAPMNAASIRVRDELELEYA